MDKIGAYSAYQQTYAETAANRKDSSVCKKETGQVKNADQTKTAEKVQLSEKAKNLLKELQKKYGNMDFIVADYETEEEASALLSRGTKEYSVLIDPDTLEKMASDEEEKQKYINLLEESIGKLTDIKEQLEENGENVKRIGISIGEDGIVSYFAELEKLSEKQRESKEPAWIGSDKSKSVFVKADLPEELLEKIQNVDWSSVEEKVVETSGNHIDFSV